MWRAYGGSDGVALVLNAEPFMGLTDKIRAFSSPVMYASHEQVNLHLHRVFDLIENNREWADAIPTAQFVECLFLVLLVLAICTKHPGFHEEREWRVMYFALPEFEKDAVIQIPSKLEVVRGVPQRVFKIPLKPFPEHNYDLLSIPNILHSLIIGPTDQPWVMYDAFRQMLDEAGVQNAADKIRVSAIPLRRT
ncbi:MAG: DUF2971 domain-containing protein [Pseudomonadota bacterium]